IIPRPVVDELRNLVALRLEDNGLTSIPQSLFEINSLVELNLGYNQISVLPLEIGKLTNLEQLYLHENKLSTLPLQLGLLKRLKILDITGNKITWLPGCINDLENLYILWADGNPAVKPSETESSRSNILVVSPTIPMLSYFAKQVVGKTCASNSHYYCTHSQPTHVSSQQSPLLTSHNHAEQNRSMKSSDVLHCVRTMLPRAIFSSCPKLRDLIPRCTKCQQMIFNDPELYYIESLECILRHWILMRYQICGPACT
ncbi:hypothetical protein K7432_014140, partial [Basidiobolus ranarum]